MSSQCVIALLVYRKSGKTNSNNPKSITLLRHLVYQDSVENAFAYCTPRRLQRALFRHTTHASGFGVNFSDQENVPPTHTHTHCATPKPERENLIVADRRAICTLTLVCALFTVTICDWPTRLPALCWCVSMSTALPALSMDDTSMPCVCCCCCLCFVSLHTLCGSPVAMCVYIFAAHTHANPFRVTTCPYAHTAHTPQRETHTLAHLSDTHRCECGGRRRSG